ncbi:MAG: flagellar brake protein [Burkholderiales bacterium]|nr:flagellar brake protein [Burkholderiales bacterium]
MSDALRTAPGPETRAELLQAHQLTGALAIHARQCDSQLLRHTAEHLWLDLPASPDGHAALIAQGIVVVALPENIRIQFDCPQPRITGNGDRFEVICAMPTLIHRIQRRDAYRVRPPMRRPVQCVMRPFQGQERAYQVLDVSATGVALAIDPEFALPAIGEIWQHCRLEIPGYAPIPCDLDVRVIGPAPEGDPPGNRIGCLFHRPIPVQVYVRDAERLLRRHG